MISSLSTKKICSLYNSFPRVQFKKDIKYFSPVLSQIIRMSMKLTKPLVLILSLFMISWGNMPEKVTANASVLPDNADIDSFCSTFFSLLGGEASKPDYDVFKKALTGFLNLKAENKIQKNILTIIDFSISSRLDRMWIIDMNKMEVTHRTLVAHGKNSGVEFASHFSNTPNSNQSSLGFYVTGEICQSQHGISLYLDGVEPGINDKARERGIIMHGADYVSKDFIRRYGVLGRSFGCPAIPMEDHEKIINMLAGKSCIYIHSPDRDYQNSSRMFTPGTALRGMSLFLGELPGITDTGSDI